jgi:AraC-like DNA-binding protein
MREIDPTLSTHFPAGAFVVRQTPGVIEQSVRAELADAQAEGWEFGACVRRGFSLTLADVINHERMACTVPSADFLKLHIQLDGHQVIGGPGMNDTPVHSGRMAYLAEPEAKLKNAVVDSGRLRTVTITCDREFVAPLLSTMSAPSALLHYVDEPGSLYRFQDAPVPPAMRLIAEQLISLPSGPLADLLMEAKSLELLYQWLNALSAAPAIEPLSARNRDKAQALKEMLDTRDSVTMSIAQLSRDLAWNETQMMESFKHLTGVTISAYRQRLRMNRALAQLRETNRPITDIAFEAGYEHQANFATAFKRAFGLPPRRARMG